MAIRTVISEPRLSTKTPDFLWFYYDERRDTRQCGALVPKCLQDLIHVGTTIDTNNLSYDHTLGASVLRLDFDQAPAHDLSLPPDPERGWRDPDHLTALDSGPALSRPAPDAGQRGMRGDAYRKQLAAQGGALPVGLLGMLDHMSRSYLYLRTRIGATDPPRSDHARAMAITAAIAWSRENGLGDPKGGPEDLFNEP